MFPRQDPAPPQTAAPAAVPAPEHLQFRTVEAEDASVRRCRMCGTPIAGEYYQVRGEDACPECAQTRQAQQERQGTSNDFLRAGLYGFGAALAGMALYAVVSFASGLQLSLIAIVVGVMVGKAVVKGAGGCQGRRYQILAVALTYLSITLSFVPLAVSALAKQGHAVTGLYVVALAVDALVSPFLELVDGFSGIINLVIIAIGLSQAWRLTRPRRFAIAGPYAP